MSPLAAIFTFALLLTVSSAAPTNNPELKISLDYALFEGVKQHVVQPTIEEYLLKKPLNKTIRLNDTGYVISYDANFSNPQIIELDVDWNNTHFLTPGDNNSSVIKIRNLTAVLSMEYSIYAWGMTSTGICNVSLSGIDINVTIASNTNPARKTHYLTIPNAAMDYKKIWLSFDSSVLSRLSDLATYIISTFSKGSITGPFQKVMTEKVSDTLKNASYNGIYIPYKNYTAIVTIPEQPNVIVSPEQSYITVGVDINIVNNVTGEYAPQHFDEFIVDHRIGGYQLQILVASNMLNQVFWVAQQEGLIKATISKKNMSPTTPISLTTTGLRILFPELADRYGLNKGIYINVLSASKAPQIYTRDARMIIMLPTHIDFWVDLDGTNYPDEGLENCTNSNCVKGLGFNSTLVIELNLYDINTTNIGATILNIDMVDLSVISGDGFMPEKIQKSMNNLFASMIPGIDSKLDGGIAIPLESLLGIQDVSLNINKNYLCFGISMKKTDSHQKSSSNDQ